ncbi:MAG: hypothetical protein HFH45_01290 [Bacilli bacterium]|nr:hypothetical protein [Bacilli bacterium]
MSKDVLAIIGIIIGIIIGLIIFALCICLEGLIFWLAGSLIVFAFGIDFQFTYLMGLAIAIVANIIGNCFKK